MLSDLKLMQQLLAIGNLPVPQPPPIRTRQLVSTKNFLYKGISKHQVILVKTVNNV